jgi:hypothetical protein
MTNLSKRLAALEARVYPQQSEEPRGAYEIHFTEARPPGGDVPDAEVHACAEPDHGANCGVQLIPIAAPIRRVYLLRGPWKPLT